MADTKITALTAITTVDPANDVLPIVDVSDTSMAASGTTKKITTNQLLGASGTATLASATITGDLTVATDRLKVVTGSTAIQTGATTQLQVGTTSWPSTVIGKSGSRSLFGNAGEVIIWNEAAAAIGNYSTLFVSAKTGAGATTMGGLQIRAGIENASNSDGFVSFWTSNNTAGGFVERYKIDSTGVSTWSVGGSTAMILNSTGLGIGTTILGGQKLAIGSSSDTSATANGFNIISNRATITTTCNGAVDAAGTTINYSWANGGQGPLIFRNTTVSNVMTLDASGNVGIGVTPSYKLHVNGRVSYSTGIGEGADLTLSSTGTQVQHGISSTWTSQNFYTGGTSRVVMKQNGQVRFVPLAADPAGAEAGDVYYNSTSNKLKCYNGTTWNDLF